ncbi:hypothetical protein [Moorella sp. ACPs]|uniref:hypothetical protein n=1 Tax=Neomoorella carbonis TaxID=3062783 RepID=UPI003251C1B2
MQTKDAWWHLFTLTGSIEAYLLYRGILYPEKLTSLTEQQVAAGDWQRERML